MRRKLQKRYPDLGSYDTARRAHATSEFLHDFVLDVGLVERFGAPSEEEDHWNREEGKPMYTRVELGSEELDRPRHSTESRVSVMAYSGRRDQETDGNATSSRVNARSRPSIDVGADYPPELPSKY